MRAQLVKAQLVDSNILFEGTMDYWPGFSDDGTADKLSEINKKTSKIQNTELEKMEKGVLAFKGVSGDQDFFQKWMYANMITTSLQRGFYIKKSLLERALELYKEALEESQTTGEDTFRDDGTYFTNSLELIINRVEEELSHATKDEIYSPHFMKNDDEKTFIDNEHTRFRESLPKTKIPLSVKEENFEE